MAAEDLALGVRGLSVLGRLAGLAQLEVCLYVDEGALLEGLEVVVGAVCEGENFVERGDGVRAGLSAESAFWRRRTKSTGAHRRQGLAGPAGSLRSRRCNCAGEFDKDGERKSTHETYSFSFFVVRISGSETRRPSRVSLDTLYARADTAGAKA